MSPKDEIGLKLGVVVIGRNEGERLVTCLRSASDAQAVIYVDSNSTDGSVEAALNLKAQVVELDLTVPFTAARARNAGLARLLEVVPDLPYVQFVDGDCELIQGWLATGVAFLDSNSDVAAVCGRLRERYPNRSVYNWLCDKEWDRPSGEVRAFAGNVMVRTQAFRESGGYREDVIAAEEDELSVRLRRSNWRIWRLPQEMAVHDAAMTHFGQWWRRTCRAGYAFAQGSYLHGASPEHHFVWEARRAMIWGFLLPLSALAASITVPRIGWMFWLVYPTQFARLILKQNGPLSDRVRLASFQLLARFPEAVGLGMFWRDRMLNRRPKIIEHKQIPTGENP